MNYVAEFYKSNAEERKENASNFFKNVEMTEDVSEKIDKLKLTIKRAQREIAKSEENIKELSGLLYSKEYETIDKKYVIRYSGSRNGGDYYFTAPAGVVTNPNEWEEEDEAKTIIINAENKTGEIYIPVGYLYENAAVIAREYHYSITGTYSKANFNIINTYIIGIFDDYCYSSTGDYSTGRWGVKNNILRRITAAPFLEKFYGLENLKSALGNDYNLGQVCDNYHSNKAFEIILKTAPDSLKRKMITTSYSEAAPVYKLLNLKKETWDKAIEKGIEEYVYELGAWLTDPKFNKTEMEWIDFIEYINGKQADLDFYEIEYNPRWNTRNYNGNRFEICRLIGTLAYSYNRYECFRNYYSFGKFSDYAIEETINQGYTSVDSFVDDLRDYLSMCINQDTKPTLYSSYLKQTHDIAARNFKLYVSEQDEKKFEEHYKDVNAAYYGDYVIMPPKSTKDVRQEGNALNHCVASYIKRIIDNETTILFLRKKEKKDESLVTLEVRNGGIIQARGAHNRKVTKDELAVIKRYAENRELVISASVSC